MDNTNIGLKTLKIDHIGDSPEEDARIAISPGAVKMVASKDIRKHNRDLKQVTIYFADGDATMFIISGFDLMTLEEVIAGYSEPF